MVGCMGVERRLPTLLEPLILPPVVHALLQALMGTPWRVMRVGSIPTQPGADAGDCKPQDRCVLAEPAMMSRNGGVRRAS